MDEITQAHREAAAKAHVAGRVLVLDRGPIEPKPIETIDGVEPSESLKEHHARLVREHAEWHERHKEPVAHRMLSVDATEAAARDPDRYSIIPRAAAEPVTIEDRMTRVERHLKLGAYAEKTEATDEIEVDDARVDETEPVGGEHGALGPGAGEPIPSGLPQREVED